ncbi:MAG: nitrate ABC transporter substrate-binding protein [Azospirillum sp.]|nr:nitrate ABC transporter substrate-binding protein [Azospirillum sp.]
MSDPTGNTEEVSSLLAAARRALPGGGHAGGSERLEKTHLTLGIVMLTDSAAIVIAREKGCFARHGLDVKISRQPSWASIRDRLAIGALDAAQMLAGMPLALSLGLEPFERPALTAFSMGLGGNAITVSTALHRRMVEADPEAMAERPTSARALRAVIAADRFRGKPPLTFAMVYPYSDHNFELRYWLAAAGINPETDLRLTVVPPPQMVAALRQGAIDGYCVGEPWNGHAVRAGIGCTVIASCELWNNHPSKVLGVTRDWAERHPNTHKALIQALLESVQWLDRPENRLEAARLVGGADYVDAPFEVVAMSLTGAYQFQPQRAPLSLPEFHVFHRYAANFPWRSQAVWLMTQMIRWGQLRRPVDLRQIADSVYRPDLYREAAAGLGISAPEADVKPEGMHSAPWSVPGTAGPVALGPDRFFDGAQFDPADPLGYLRDCPIRHPALSLADIAEVAA